MKMTPYQPTFLWIFLRSEGFLRNQIFINNGSSPPLEMFYVLYKQNCVGQYSQSEILLGHSFQWESCRRISFSLSFFFFFCGHTMQHVGPQFSDQRSNPRCLHRRHGVLISGSPGKFPAREFLSLRKQDRYAFHP